MISIDCLVTTFNYSEKDINNLINRLNVFTHTIIRNQTNATKQFRLMKNGHNVDVYFAKDIGLSKNRNELLKLSKSEYVMFCDDDEIIDVNVSKYIEYAYQTIKCDAYAFQVNGSYRDSFFTSKIKNNTFRRSKWKDVRNKGIMQMIIKRELATKIMFDERIGSGTKYLCGEDTLFMHRLFKTTKNIYSIGKPIGHIHGKTSLWQDKRDSDFFLLTKGFVYQTMYGNLSIFFIIRFLIKSKRFSFKNLKTCLKGYKTINSETK